MDEAISLPQSREERTRMFKPQVVKYALVAFLLLIGLLIISMGWASQDDVSLPPIENGDEPIDAMSHSYGNLATLLTAVAVIVFLLRRGLIKISGQTLQSKLRQMQS